MARVRSNSSISEASMVELNLSMNASLCVHSAVVSTCRDTVSCVLVEPFDSPCVHALIGGKEWAHVNVS